VPDRGEAGENRPPPLLLSRRDPQIRCEPAATSDSLVKEDQDQTRRNLRAAIVFGVVAATLEMAVFIYFLL
jgi:hypothetical protein